MANFAITINARVNLPPSQVGDNSLTTNHETTIIFSEDDFTTNTVPPYVDPEGDAPENLRVLSLPIGGTLNLSGVAVTVNQVIPFTSISAGNFTYVPSSLTNLRTVDFDFEVSDTGSGQYTG